MMPGKILFSFSLTLCGALSFSVGFPAFLSFSVGFRRIWTSAVPIASPHHLNLDNNNKAKKNFNLFKAIACLYCSFLFSPLTFLFFTLHLHFTFTLPGFLNPLLKTEKRKQKKKKNSDKFWTSLDQKFMFNFGKSSLLSVK